MKKLALLLTLCLFSITAKSQIPTLSSLIKFVNIPLADLTEEVIAIDGWELSSSEVVDSVITLQFDHQLAILLVKKVRSHKNEISLTCNKLSYDNLNKSLLALKPKLIDSKINENGHLVKTYVAETYGYRVLIAPKSVFAFQVYDLQSNFSGESFPFKSSSIFDANLLSIKYSEGRSGIGETPIPLSKFTNLATPQDDGLKSGKIAVRIRINKSGIVTQATPGVKGTTLNDRELWQRCKDAIIGARLSVSDAAPGVEIGVVVFNFKVR